jgi:hypothetical protein
VMPSGSSSRRIRRLPPFPPPLASITLLWVAPFSPSGFPGILPARR